MRSEQEEEVVRSRNGQRSSGQWGSGAVGSEQRALGARPWRVRCLFSRCDSAAGSAATSAHLKPPRAQT